MTALRFTVSIGDAAALPAIELDRDPIVIGGDAEADLRLPVAIVAARQLRLFRASGRWRVHVIAPLVIDDLDRAGGDVVDLAPPASIRIGTIRIEVAETVAAGAPAVRTASLAREIVRAMVASAASEPELVVIAGPATGARRGVPPPPSRLVIGRGDGADWIIVDPDLSRAHVAIERSWDFTVVRDLDSKNGTKVADVVIGVDGVPVDHDAVIVAGSTALRYLDPAARYLAELSAPAPSQPAADQAPPAPPALEGRLVFWLALALAALALAALLWIL